MHCRLLCFFDDTGMCDINIKVFCHPDNLCTKYILYVLNAFHYQNNPFCGQSKYFSDKIIFNSQNAFCG